MDDGTSRIMVALSVACGVDLTPEGDLKDRLSEARQASQHCLDTLESVEQAVRRYEQLLSADSPPRS